MALPTRDRLPLILIRGFGGFNVEDEKRIAYQGFNDGAVYPGKRGENYIYEGLILRFLKSSWRYHDATNVVGYYGSKVTDGQFPLPDELSFLPTKYFVDDKVVIDPAMALNLIQTKEDPLRTLWVFRYYDLDHRKFEIYGKALVRLIDFIRSLTAHTHKNGSKPLGAGLDRLIWDGYLDTSSILEDRSITIKDMVMRLDVYLGERDIYGVGFSDNVIFRKQYYLRALLNNPFTMYIHADERFAQPDFQASPSDEVEKVRDGWEFKVKGTGFEATLRVEFDEIPLEGSPA